MTLLSRKADYALLILSHLHHHPQGASAREIAVQFGLSRAFVANILKELVQKGFAASSRGVKGGYVLRRDTGSITLAELLESLEDGFQLTVCSHEPHHTVEVGFAVCELESRCTVKTSMTEIHRRLMEVLRGVTLADIYDPNGLSAIQPSVTLTLTMRAEAGTTDPQTV